MLSEAASGCRDLRFAVDPKTEFAHRINVAHGHFGD
jgi:hypothetical protein